jgi:uncharacterized protein
MQHRTRRQRLIDAVLEKVQRRQGTAGDYTFTRDLQIPTRDGVTLLADLLVPVGSSKGTVLVRSPYGFGVLVGSIVGTAYASRGYHVLLARCRGTFGSGGTFDPMMSDIDDAADTAAWIREQPWFDGRLATSGGSYLGFTQWALLMDPPLELKAAVISISPHDFYEVAHLGGAFSLVDFLGWSNQIVHQEDGPLRRARGLATMQRTLARVAHELPIVDAGERLMGDGAPWYREWVSRVDPADPRWAPMQLSAALERVNVPVLLVSGWQDIFIRQTFHQYERLSERGLDVAFTVGPWTHVEVGTKGGAVMFNETVDWLDEHVAGNDVRSRAKPVRVYVTGADQWRDLDHWPPPTTPRTWYPIVAGRLADEVAPAGGESTFTYDPHDPTPSIGGPIMIKGGYRDDGALAARDDVLAFDSDPLTRPLEVLGVPVVELGHATDNPHADVFVRVSEVDTSGRSQNVTEGFRRLDPDAANGTIRLELDPIAHRFKAGHRIRLLIAGGSHPRFDRNLGSGGDPGTSSAMAHSTRSIDLASTSLTMPVGD